MTAVPVPPLTDEETEAVQKRLEQSQRAYPVGSPSLAWAIRFYLEDMPRVLASLRAAREELAQRTEARDMLREAHATAFKEWGGAERERDEARAALARAEETAAEARRNAAAEIARRIEELEDLDYESSQEVVHRYAAVEIAREVGALAAAPAASEPEVETEDDYGWRQSRDERDEYRAARKVASE